MSKVRIYELAKEVGVESKSVIVQAEKLGITVEDHLTLLEDSAVASLREFFKSGGSGDVVQTRVRSTVIRRRRTRVSAKEVAETPPVEEVTPEKEPEVEVAPAVAEVAEEVAPEEPTPEVVQEEASAPAAEEEIAPVEVAEEEPSQENSEESAKPAPRPLSRRRTLEINPEGRPTATQAVVVKAPPPGFQAPDRTPNRPPRSGDRGRPQGGYNRGPGGPPPGGGGRRFDGPPRPGGGGGFPPPGGGAGGFPSDGRGERRGGRGHGEQRGEEERRKRKPGRRIVDQNLQNWNPRMAHDDDFGRRRRRGPKKKKQVQTELTVPKAAKRIVKLDEVITVAEMAQQMSVKASDLIRKLMSNGVMAGLNHVLDFDTAALMAEEYGFTVENVGFELTDYVPTVEDMDGSLVTRSPVVTIMGHVDHGKTSLLDYIRNAKVADGEAGGITQHIGAYEVDMADKGSIVFLDTPGHEAFTQMRARGAQVTDIVILVVAADDGVMPQTIEAISHSKAAEVPIIVACNKMDKENAQPDRVLQQLAEHELVPEDWGGDTTVCKVSAHTGEGIDNLLEMLALQAELLELQANPDKPGNGVIIEAELDRGRGTVSSMLVQDVTVNKGDYVVSGSAYGRVRAMTNYRGEMLDSAGPSTPVELLGMNSLPGVSDPFYVVADEKKARAIVSYRESKDRQKELGQTARMSLEGLFEQMQAGEVADLNIILKCDVQGSIEAIRKSLDKLQHDEVKINILHAAAGGISDSDVNLANASNALIIGFNVRAESTAKMLAEREAVSIKIYNVIYDAINDVKAAMEGLLTPDIEERETGHAEVRETFGIPKVGTIAGCMVKDGVIRRGGLVRLFRDNVLIWSGSISSLRRFKEDVREVKDGYECGIGLLNYNDIKSGDIIEVYEKVEVAKTIE